jgi:2,4-dienoyl-CoA reductase-like NADH-dependent reductase (Old Yellow Enzyme family)/thioredoxin reductase
MQKYPHLFSPIQIAGHTYKNRILCAPMLFGFFVLVKPMTERLYKITETKAKGGVAEVVVGETPINCSDAPDIYFPGIEIDYTKWQGPGFEAYKGYADAIKKHDAIALIEIFHAGHEKSPLPFGEKLNPWGPMGFVRPDGVTVEAFDDRKMKKVREDFVTCSQFMKAAGFDGICIHGGHGFLFTQFLSPSSNRRTDEYGGNLEKRGRFPREILGDIRNNLGKDFIIELRLNGADLVEGGSTNEQMAEFGATLGGLVDIIHISSGFKHLGYTTQEFSSHYEPHGVNVERAANIKKKTKVPVTAVGGINSPDFAEKIIAEGKVDFVSLGRQLIADPEFPNKAKAGQTDEIRQCVRCYHCYPGGPEIPGDKSVMNLNRLGPSGGNRPMTMRSWQCSINPSVNNELEIENMPKPQGASAVLVVGGGPAGMQAAITACDRGHDVTLVEKGSSLGGILYFTNTDVHKVDLKNFKDLLVREMGKRKIKVMLNTAATPEFIEQFKPDAVILAIGALASTPAIPGLNTAIQALEAYKNESKIGKKVVMVGGGLAGCETALHLADKGHQVTIVEMLERLASTETGFALTATIRQIEKRKNITARTGLKCVEITPNSVKVADAVGKTEVIKGDTVVYSLGMSAKKAEVETLRAAAGKATVFEAGDCVRGAKVYEATFEGFMAAMKIV